MVRESFDTFKIFINVTVSKYSAKKIVQFYNVNETKIRIVPNGVDPQRFRPIKDCEKVKHRIGVSGEQCVLFVGKLIPRKGLNFLMEAAKQIVKERRGTSFVVVGSGPLKNHLISYSKKEGLSGNFVFLGDVHDEVLSTLAQAMAKPVVAFNVGGINEFVLDKETGILVKPDSYGLANAILNLLSDRSLRERMRALWSKICL